MTNDFLHQLPLEDQQVSNILSSNAQSIRANPQFQDSLEARLKEAHPENKQPSQASHIKLLPAIGWALVAIAAFLVLNWAVRSLVPNMQPAANGTPNPDATIETDLDLRNVCTGQLAAAHGFSVSLTDQDKTGFLTLDEEKTVDELRSFSWSADGQQLALVGNTRGSGNLYLANSAGSSLQPVLSNSEFGYLAGIAWSRDGQQLLTWEINNNTRVFFVDIDGAGVSALDIPLHFIETPQFAPDDQSILFLGGDSSSSGLFQVWLDGSPGRWVSNLVEDETSFAWSQDGARLAYIEMDRELGQARLVVEEDSGKTIIATLPVPRGSGSSLPNSANLSWSPDGQSLVFELGRNAGNRVIYLASLDGTEPVKLAESAHAPAISSDGNCLAFIRNQQVFLLDLTSVSSTTLPTPLLLAELPTGRGQANFQLDKLGWGSLPIPGPDTESKNISTPTPSGEAYDWRGVKLYLNAPLPDAPAEANVYQIQPAQPATLETTVALAAQYGMSGDVYETPSLQGDDESDFIVVDGNQRLLVGSNLFFSYYPDYARWIASGTNAQLPEQTIAEEMIAAFLTSHGLDFSYKVVPSEFFSGYYALPLTPDGFTVHHEHFSLAGLLFRFDNDDIVAVEANLTDYTPLQNFGITSAEAAFQKVLDPNTMYGIREGMHSATKLIETWNRHRPENQTITVWGWISSFKSVDVGSPLVTFDGYRAAGNIANIPEATPNTYVEAIGQFQTVNGTKTFEVESWQVYNGYEEGLQGIIQRDGERVTLTTIDGNTLTLPDPPADLPLPIEDAFVLGVTQGDVYEWKSIDTRMQGGGGGGGGGGGSGFYIPNLTGTPVPLPTTIQASQATGTGEYIVQEGDTLSGITESYGITVDELMQANGLNEATIFIGQSLIIPGSESGPEQPILGQSFDKIRGTLTVTIFNLSDGGQRVEYSLQVIEEDRYLFMRLGGNDLDALQAYNNRPIKVSGTVDRYMTDLGMEIPVLNVEQFEVLYPDQQFQILKGTQSVIDIQGKSITLFTTEDGQTYTQPETFSGVIGNEGDLVLVEALVLPEETIAGYPALQVVNASMAVNPKNGQSVEMEVTANKPYVMEEIEQPQPPAELFATIELVELVYFTPNQRYKTPNTSTGPVYIQPVWRFQGHYWDGSEFEILVQALKDEFLLPEIETIEPPG